MREFTTKFAVRFLSRVDCTGGFNACWPWLGCIESAGYGVIWWKDRNLKAHRVAYKIAYGVDPGDLCVCHTCDNPPCCNPLHLFLGTHLDNARDKIKKGRDKVIGEANKQCKTTDAQVAEIRRLYAEGGISQAKIGKMFGLQQAQVSAIIRYKSRR